MDRIYLTSWATYVLQKEQSVRRALEEELKYRLKKPDGITGYCCNSKLYIDGIARVPNGYGIRVEKSIDYLNGLW